MGYASCFRKSRRCSKSATVVHPLDHHQHHPRRDEEGGGGGGGVRSLKVRMTSGQLKELMAELKSRDSSKGPSDSELGRLVFRECLEGRLHARLVHDYSDHQSTTFTSGKSLSTIKELSDDDEDGDHHHHQL